MKFDVNCSILFTELPLLQRPAAAAAAGFDAVEFWWPFDSPVPDDRAVDDFLTAISDAGVQLVGLNFIDELPAERGLVSVPQARQRFADNIDVAVGIAERAGCPSLNALYGNRREDISARHQDELAVENLVAAGKSAERIGATVLVEPLNAHESPNYPLTSAEDALAVIDRVAEAGADNLALLADLYHLARMDADLPAVIGAYAGRFGHVQIADAPGRGAPGTGSLDFSVLFDRLETHGYSGWIGLEYKGTNFDWLNTYRKEEL